MIKKFNIRRAVKLLIVVMILLVLLISCVYWTVRVCKSYYDDYELKSLNLSKVNKLMIVAHPDDETIWGGGHLTEGGYLVICITDGYNKTRSEEFFKAVKHTNESNVPFIMNFPDKTFNKRDNWYGIKDKIEAAVDECLDLKDWELIATHNKEGEYGHIHHKMTSSIVRQEYKNLDKRSPLYLFGTYYSNKKLPKHEASMTPLADDVFNKKAEVLSDYESQKKVVNQLYHMIRYENWSQYEG